MTSIEPCPRFQYCQYNTAVGFTDIQIKSYCQCKSTVPGELPGLIYDGVLEWVVLKKAKMALI